MLNLASLNQRVNYLTGKINSIIPIPPPAPDDLQAVLTAGNDADVSIVLKNTLVAPTSTLTIDENNITHSATGATDLSISSNQNITLTGDNIDLSSTGRLIIPTLGGGSSYLDFNAPTGRMSLLNSNAGGALNPQLSLTNTNATGSVALEIYKNKPTAGIAGDPLFTQSVFGKDAGNAKQEYTRITHTIRDNTAGSEEGSIEMGCFVAGTYANMIQLNGVDVPNGEINVLRPIDLTSGSTGLIKVSGSGSTDMTLDATLSAGTGNINLNPKISGKVVSNGSINLPSTTNNFTIGTFSSGYSATISSQNANFNDVAGNRSGILAFNALTMSDTANNKSSSLDSEYLYINDTTNNKSVSINNNNGLGAGENRIDLFKNSGGGISNSSGFSNTTTTQQVFLNSTDNAVGKNVSVYNNTSGNGGITYDNSQDANPFILTSNNTSLTLQTNGTTAGSGNIEFAPSQNGSANGQIVFTGASLQSNTAGGNSGEHLVITLNGVQYKIKLELP